PITGPDPARVHEDYLSTHMLLITSRQVIKRAIQKSDLHDLEQFRGTPGLRQQITDWLTDASADAADGRREERRVTDIINALVVTRDAQKPGVSPSNEVINLSFRGKVAGDCPKILNAIIASYQDFLQEN